MTLSSLGSVDFSFFVSLEFCFHSKFPVHLGKFIAASGVVKCLCLESAECKLKKKKKMKHHLDVLRTLTGEHSVMIPLY